MSKDAHASACRDTAKSTGTVGLQGLLQCRYFLAPMAGISDMPFRLLMSRHGAELVTSELISAEGFVHGSRQTRQMMLIHEQEHPAGIQIFGSNAESLSAIAMYAEDQGADFIDINFGCPVPKVTKSGAGSAMLRDPANLGRMVAAVRKCVSVPVSIKIRSGWDDSQVTAPEVIRIAAGEGAAWVTLHARTRAQGYEGRADWGLVASMQALGIVPVVGNGDVASAREAVKRVTAGDCHAVMLGRAALADPLIFRKIRSLSSQDMHHMPDLISLLEEYHDLVMHHNHPRERHVKLKKVFAWWSEGRVGHAGFRKRIFALSDQPDAVLSTAREFFSQTPEMDPAGTGLDFLKGGHG